MTAVSVRVDESVREVDETKTFDLEWIEGMAPPPGSDDVSMTTKPLRT